MSMTAEARALASPLRLRILRICLHEPRTNKEIAQTLGMNPGSTLHHVRTLVNTGFLAAQAPRKGARGAREVPYLATQRSWDTPVPGIGPILVQTFLDEAAEVAPDDLGIIRLGLKVTQDDAKELLQRLQELLVEFKDRPSSPDGDAISVFVAVHPDRSA
ncbi:ArsR/SmtB family transcription factor [Humibacter ginsenosidimutans]|uniref:Winged helix-turn-helix transcriptional regulator n=1 Tax=Humibacter ginsenosidimutans TaxID=2599293 RepID=A0A5B8M1K8_9MICO|nr:winged helix-turn-helix domain-containing protein [Humibacter ginsenosidimutans]QDZ13809.1 winged helix-turn-helix transcriptional regulator [Humibacter ginsenosidimutans]